MQKKERKAAVENQTILGGEKVEGERFEGE